MILKKKSMRSPNRNVATLYHRTVNRRLYWNYEIMQMQIMIADRTGEIVQQVQKGLLAVDCNTFGK